MTSSQELALLLVLVGSLVALGLVAGGLWWRLRGRAIVEVAHLADVLVTRLRTLDALLARLESLGAPPPEVRGPSDRPARAVRIDAPAATAVPGPTLIAVPDLSTGLGEL